MRREVGRVVCVCFRVRVQWNAISCLLKFWTGLEAEVNNSSGQKTYSFGLQSYLDGQGAAVCCACETRKNFGTKLNRNGDESFYRNRWKKVRDLIFKVQVWWDWLFSKTLSGPECCMENESLNDKNPSRREYAHKYKKGKETFLGRKEWQTQRGNTISVCWDGILLLWSLEQNREFPHTQKGENHWGGESPHLKLLDSDKNN